MSRGVKNSIPFLVLSLINPIHILGEPGNFLFAIIQPVLKKFFTYQVNSFIARTLGGVLVLVAMFRALFSPEPFDQVINGLLLVLAILVMVIVWWVLSWLDRERVRTAGILRLRSEFIDFASYQLRSPSSAIMSGLSLMKEGLVDKMTPENKIQFIDSLYRRSEQLGQVIRDILQASEFDTKKISFADKHLTMINAVEMVEKIKNEFNEQADKKSLELIIKNEASKTMVKTFADYLEEAVSNLVENAIHFTQKGGVIISLHNENKDLLIEIIDTGIGIPATDLETIFERYGRASNANMTYSEGTGLGLYIAKEIVDAHKGGSISCKSVEGRGSTFVIRLPLAE
ncbi:MAG: HAMP domain-containing sensor histidine kinase [Candidatus Paceibacterota bacterium]|jgi:signal transduction histidine kinase